MSLYPRTMRELLSLCPALGLSPCETHLYLFLFLKTLLLPSIFSNPPPAQRLLEGLAAARAGFSLARLETHLNRDLHVEVRHDIA